MAYSKTRLCKDCAAKPNTPLTRPAPHPGPRCATHHREKRKRDRLRAHGRRVEAVYGITEARYWELYELQGGRCAICRRGRGKSRRLAVDHDHTCCPGKTSCGQCVRGLVCAPCNDELAHARDDKMHFTRAITYLIWPPAQSEEAFEWKAMIERIEP